MSSHQTISRTCGILAAALIPAMSLSAAEATHRYFRFNPTLLRDDASANSIQLAEFEFSLDGIPLDLTGVTVTNPAGNSPPAEGPPNVIDLNTSSKWLDFNKSALIFDFGVGATATIDAYNFSTANDATERDPISWTLEGSDDGTTWELLSVVSNYPTTAARQTAEAGFALTTALPPVITAFEAVPTIILNGTTSNLSWTTENATDFEIDQSVGPVPASGIEPVSPPDNADTTYTLTISRGTDSMSAQTTVRTVAGGTGEYQYYRFNPIQMRGAGSENSIQLAEFEFLNAGASLDRTGVIVTNPDGDNPGSGLEGPENLIDGVNTTKWLDFNKSAIVFDFGSPVVIDGYRFITANDFSSRDPARWTLEGSADGFDWILIDNVTAFDFLAPNARFTATQDIPLPGTSLLPFIQIQFYADQPTAIAGEEVVLYWEITGNYDAVEIDNGIGSVDGLNSWPVTPAASTIYTLSASDKGGAPITAELPVTIVNPAITDICYADFDAAGDELQLLGDAEIVNDFATIPLPGDAKRLRLTRNLANQAGAVWFRKRLDFSEGFDTTFDLHLVSGGQNTGADGIAFVIHDTHTGTGTIPTEGHENGLPDFALNIKFDSHQNAVAGDLSAAVIQVLDGPFLAAEADLSINPAIALGGTDPLDLTQDADDTPYRVRITYEPGDLNVYFDGVHVIANANVDLDASLAVDAAGMGFVGFTSRTGGSFETHDITSWCLTEGPPPPRFEIGILASSFDFNADTVALTFSSADTRTYRVTSSTDGINFTNVLASGVSGATGLTETTTTVNFTQLPVMLIRVEQE